VTLLALVLLEYFNANIISQKKIWNDHGKSCNFFGGGKLKRNFTLKRIERFLQKAMVFLLGTFSR
jgi:preprotein translocase subunit SecG